jgi:DNA polymerase III sliding clamp (beta) subunit (PCNA family)
MKLLTTEKPSKAIAYGLAKKLYSGENLDDYEKNMLLNFFAPAPSKKPKNSFEWVALVVRKKDVRQYLNFVYSDGTRIMATDGHRVHYSESELQEGFYCPKTGLKVEENLGNFPNIDKVLPDERRSHIVLDKNELDIIKINDKINAYKVGDGLGVNSNYLKDALQNVDTFRVDKSEKEHIQGFTRFYGKNDFGKFTIMACKV